MRRKLMILPLRISIVLPLLLVLPLERNVLSFNSLEDSDVLDSLYLLRLRVPYSVDGVPFKTNKSELPSSWS
jgi:hypothetical protein